MRVLESSADGNGWMEQFKKYRNITKLDRTAVVSLIDRIFIYRDRRMDIIYNCQDEIRLLDETLAQMQGMDGGTEISACGLAGESCPDSGAKPDICSAAEKGGMDSTDTGYKRALSGQDLSRDGISGKAGV